MTKIKVYNLDYLKLVLDTLEGEKTSTAFRISDEGPKAIVTVEDVTGELKEKLVWLLDIGLDTEDIESDLLDEEEWDDEDECCDCDLCEEEVEEELERVSLKTKPNTFVAVVLDPTIEEGKLIDNPLVVNGQIALGHSIDEVLENFGHVIGMIRARGLEVDILPIEDDALKDMISKGERYIPTVAALQKVKDSIGALDGNVSIDKSELLQSLADAMTKVASLNEDDNYNATHTR